MPRAICLVIGLSAAGCTFGGGAAAPASAPVPALTADADHLPRIGFEEFTLPNGLRVIVHEDRSTPIVAVVLEYEAGDVHDPEGRLGFGHLFEHMMFQETERLAKGELWSLLAEAGATGGAGSNVDRTMYRSVVPSNRVDLVLWLEAERMVNLRVTEENLRREREVVREEMLNFQNLPYYRAERTMYALLSTYPLYRYGIDDQIDDPTPAEAYAFYRQYYVPNNATLILAGDIGLKDAKTLVRRYLGSVPRGPDPLPLPPAPAVPRNDGERRATVESPLARSPRLLVGYTMPPRGHSDAYAISLLTDILGRGPTSRIVDRLTRAEQAASAVDMDFYLARYTGQLHFEIEPRPGAQLSDIEALLSDEVERLVREGVTPQELNRAKQQWLGRTIRDRETVSSKATALQDARFFHGDPRAANIELDRYLAVTAEDILRVARTYLTPANRAVVVAVPAPAAASGEGR